MVSLLPEEAVARLQKALGSQWKSQQPVEIQALVTADVEGRVTNARLREMTDEHPNDLTKTLQGLVSKGFLVQVGMKRGTFYRLTTIAQGVDAQHSMRNDDDSMRKDSTRNGSNDQKDELIGIAAPAREKRRLSPARMQPIILELCNGRYLSLSLLSEVLQRNPEGLRTRLLSPLLQSGQLVMRFPNEPNRPDQAYTTKKKPGAI